MRKTLLISLMITLLAVLISACQPTGDTQADTASAQNLQPNIVGYTTSNADSLVSAITTAGAGAALTTGNAPLAAAIARADTVIACLRSAGAVDARTYLQNAATNIIPEAGVSIIINQTRVNRNLLACLTTTGDSGLFSQQAVTIEPCTGSGNFRFQNEEFTYIYVGVGSGICGFFSQHFDSIRANNQS